MSITFTSENLPAEVLTLVFSHSSSKELLLTGQLLNKHWHRVANQPIVWQRFIRRECPDIMEDTKVQYLNDPKGLYISEVNNLDRKTWRFDNAVARSNIDMVQSLLTQPGPKIPAQYKRKALNHATLAYVADHNVVQALLTLAGQQISPNDKYNALLGAVTPWTNPSLNAIHVVRTLLTQISVTEKGKALVESITSTSSAEVVQELLKGVDVSYVIEALKRGIEHHRQDRVNAILSQRGHELSHPQLIEALGTNGAIDYRASKRNIARSLALEGAGELNNQEDDEVQTARKRPRN